MIKNILIILFFISAITMAGLYINENKNNKKTVEENNALKLQTDFMSIQADSLAKLRSENTAKSEQIDKLKEAVMYCAGLLENKSRTSTSTSCRFSEATDTLDCTTY